MSKYCPEIVDRICNSLKSKHGRVWSAEEAGIDFQTFCRWIKDQSGFSDAVKKAEEEGRERQKADLLLIIEEHAKKFWQAGAWILERRYSEEFALKTKQEISGYLEGSETDKERKDRLVKLKGFLNTMDLPDGKKKTEKALAPA